MATLDQLLLERSAQSQKRIQETANDMIVEVRLNELRSRLESSIVSKNPWLSACRNHVILDVITLLKLK